MDFLKFLKKPGAPLDELAEQLEQCRNHAAESRAKVEAEQITFDEAGSAAALRNLDAAIDELKHAEMAEGRAERLYQKGLEREELNTRKAKEAEAAKLEDQIALLQREDASLAKREAKAKIQAIELRDERRKSNKETMQLRLKLDGIRRELGQEVTRSISDSNIEPSNTPVFNAIEIYIKDLDGNDPRRKDARRLLPERNILAGVAHDFKPARSAH